MMTNDETIITSIKNIEDDEGDKKPYLTLIKGVHLGQIYPIDKKEIVVGRSPDCNIWIEDSAISRKHFKIITKNNKLSVEDLNSTNGTYVNGNPVKKTNLEGGDKIQISQNTIFELTYLDETKSLSEKQRYEMGVLDPVTNIYNKRYLLDRLKEEFSFAHRRNRNLSLMMIDIDYFKKINDSYGHLAGDVVLQKICVLISDMIRSDDIFARYGGEEFVIMMRDADVKNAFDLAERIRLKVSQNKIIYEKKKIVVTISCGISTLTEAHADYLSLISDADKYLYQSKKGGRNRVTGP